MVTNNKKHKCNLCTTECFKKTLCLHTYNEHGEELKKRLIAQNSKYRYPYSVDWGLHCKLYFCLVCRNIWDNQNWAMRHTTHNPGCNQRAQLEAINNFVKEDNEVRVSKDKEERVILDAPRVSKDKEVREKNTIQETTPEVVEDNVIDKCLDLLQQLSIQLKLLKKNKTIIVPEINVLALLEKTETKIVPEIVPEIAFNACSKLLGIAFDSTSKTT